MGAAETGVGRHLDSSQMSYRHEGEGRRAADWSVWDLCFGRLIDTYRRQS